MLSQVSQLDLKELHNLDDGILAAAFRANLQIVISDLNDRPDDERTRKLKIEFAFTPEALKGDLDRVKLDYKVTHNIAGHEGRECVLTPRRIGRELALLFATVGTDATQPHLNGMESDEDE